MSLGNPEYAAELVEWFNAAESSESPPDFKLLGQGSTRFAYLRDNVVYKIEHQEWENSNANESEWNNYLTLKDNVVAPFAVPETDIIYVGDEPVIVMEYIKGPSVGYCDSECPDSCLNCWVFETTQRFGFSDL